LRETEASLYTLRDTPLFTCIRMGLAESLDALGGPKVAQPKAVTEVKEAWAEVCPVQDFAPNTSRMIYVGGQQVAVFNANGSFYAISNRCSHARGPLSEGTVNCDDAGCTVVCPWHYAKFDLATGMVVDGVASAPVPTYVVEVRDGVLHVGTRLRLG